MMRRVASTPLTRGMAISMMTTVGRSCRVRRTASAPSPASRDHLHVGFLVDDELEALPDHRVIIG